MSDLQYTVGVNTNPAIAGLASLQAKIGQTTGVFSKLQGAMAGLAVGAAVLNVIRYADAIVDLRDATGIATANIAGFSKAVTLNGGDADKAQSGIVKLVAAIGDAADGSGKAQEAFGAVGVTLKDLATLSEQDILAKTIMGLAKITDTSTQAALKAELLGKAFRGININGVAAGYGAAVTGAQNYAKSVESAAALQDKLDQSMDKFRTSVLKVFEPMANFVSNLDQEQVNKFVDAVVKIGGAAAGITILGRAIAGIGAVVATVSTAAVALWALFKSGIVTSVIGLGALTEGVKSLVKTFAIAYANITKYGPRAWFAAFYSGNSVIKEVGVTLQYLGKRFAFLVAGSAAAGGGFALMGAGLAKLIPFVAWLITGITALDWVIKKAFDFSPVDWFTNKVSAAYDAFKKFLGLKGEKTPEVSTGPALAIPTGTGALLRGVDTAAAAPKGPTDDEIKRQVKLSEAAKALAESIARQRREMNLAVGEFVKQNEETRKAIDLESLLIGSTKDYGDVARAQAALTAATTAKIEELTAAKAALTDEEKKSTLGAEYDKQIAKVKELAAAESLRLKDSIENQNRLLSLEQLRLYGIQQQIDMQSKLQGIQDEIAKSTMTTIERKYYDIEAAAKASAKAAIEAEEARTGRKLSTTEVKAYYDAAVKGAEELKKVTDQEYQNSRSFATGWAQAFNEYAENATNAAQKARDIFGKATGGMTDMLVGFAKTGKLEWKGFINDMIETLLRSEITSMMAKLFSGTMSGGKAASGGLLGGAIIPGFLASGGPASSNRSYLVGERGPEIFSPSTNGTVIPNSALGGGQNVTYNINAVDAKSFQQLVAQNPEFIYAVTLKGQRSTSGGR